MADPAALLRYVTPSTPDADLLGRFAADRDGESFAELVRRHGPVVYRVCRRLLGPASADDAFQATFLVLATRPQSVRKAGSVGSWLVGVAGRVARQMRRRERRAGGVSPLMPDSAAARDEHQRADAPRSPEWAEQFRILDEELARLPDRLRGPVVVCLLEGRTQEQAANELGGSVRTVRRRLDEAKRLLRVRLERRGVVPAVAAALAAGVGEVSARVPAGLADRTAAVVFDFLAGGAATAPPAVIAKGVAMGTLARKVKLAMAAAAVGLTALGIGVAGDQPVPRVGPPAPVAGGRIPPANIPPQPPAAAPEPAAKYETANFRVTAPTSEAARAVAEKAERARRELAKAWLGRELPDWPKPCPVRVTQTTGDPGSGTTFSYGERGGKPAVLTLEMQVRGELAAILADLIPHEVMHCVLATHFGKSLPRWADEGIAVLAESPAQQARHAALCRELHNQGRTVRLGALFAMTEYPRDMMTLYAQGYSVCQFLLTRPPSLALTMSDVLSKSLPPHPDEQARRALLVFLANATGELGWDRAANALYGFESVDALEEAWLAWLRKPPAADPPRFAVPPLGGYVIPGVDPAWLSPDVRSQLAGLPSSPVPAMNMGVAPNGRRFEVVGQPPAVARALANELAYQRRQMAGRWVGWRVPAEPAAAVRVEYDPTEAGESYLNVSLTPDGTRPALVRLRGPLAEALEADIPPLMARAVFVESLNHDLPGWALAGVPATEAPPAAQRALDAEARKLVAAGRAVKLSAFFADAVPHQPDARAQGHSVVRFLLARPVVRRDPPLYFPMVDANGKPVDVDLAQVAEGNPRYGVTEFVRRGLKAGWDAAAKEVYGFAGVDALEAAWIDWLKAPGSRVAEDKPAAPAKRADPPRIPPVKLPATEPIRVGRIIVEGNKVTYDSVILKQLPFSPGQVLDPAKLDEGRMNLIRLGIFDSDEPPTVEAVPQEGGDGVYQDIRVRVKEVQTGTVEIRSVVSPEKDLLGRAPPAGEPLVLSTRTVKLPIALDPERRKEVRELRLYASADRGKTWKQVGTAAPDQQQFVFTAEADGEYWVSLVVVLRSGRTEPADVTAAPPAHKLVIDTTPPVLRIMSLRRGPDGVVVGWETDDQNPDDARTVVEYKCAKWPGWTVVPTGGARPFRFQPGTDDPVTVRIEVRDKAGNKAEVTVNVPVAEPAPPKADAGAGREQAVIRPRGDRRKVIEALRALFADAKPAVAIDPASDGVGISVQGTPAQIEQVRKVIVAAEGR